MAKQMFAKAIELDPRYARAYAGMADCDAFLILDYSEHVSAGVVLSNSEKALELEPNLAEAHASRGMALSVSQRFQEAEKEFERALAEEPNLFEAHYFYGRSCYVQGKLAQTAVHWERAGEVKLNDYQSGILLSAVYASLGQPEEAKRAGFRGVERAEREAARNPENPRPAYLLAGVLAKFGEFARAKEWAARALAIAPDDALTRYNIACFHCSLGEYERAFDMLEALLLGANHDMKAWALIDFDFDPLHELPRWQKVMELAR